MNIYIYTYLIPSMFIILGFILCCNGDKKINDEYNRINNEYDNLHVII